MDWRSSRRTCHRTSRGSLSVPSVTRKSCYSPSLMSTNRRRCTQHDKCHGWQSAQEALSHLQEQVPRGLSVQGEWISVVLDRYHAYLCHSGSIRAIPRAVLCAALKSSNNRCILSMTRIIDVSLRLCFLSRLSRFHRSPLLVLTFRSRSWDDVITSFPIIRRTGLSLACISCAVYAHVA